METACSIVFIYGLYCPDGELRYIGKANNPKKRFASHMRESRRRTPLYDWIGSLKKKGLIPTMKVLGETSVSDWPRMEKEFIFNARLSGERILNLADGGEMPKCSSETRSKNGKNSYKGKYPGIFRAKRKLGLILQIHESKGNHEKANFLRLVISEVNQIPKSRLESCDAQFLKMAYL
jgi:hypothetical protein